MRKYLINVTVAFIIILAMFLRDISDVNAANHVGVSEQNLYSSENLAEEPEPVITISYGDGSSKKYLEIDDSLLKDFETEINAIMNKPQKWIKSTNADKVYGLFVSTNEKKYYIEKYENIYESYMVIDGCYFGVSDKLDELVTGLAESDTEVYMEPDERILTYTYECEEPTTHEDYIEVAKEIVAQWLDSLTKETGMFKIESYTFEKNYQTNESEFLADGYVDGIREWAVDVRFEVEGIPEDSVFADDLSDNLGYNTYYHYYFGPCIIVRLRWENGVCTVVNYDGAYMGVTYGGSLVDGLYGIQNESVEYPTFYEYMNDKEKVNDYLTNGIYSPIIPDVVSHNVTMLSDGRIYYIDIGSSASYEELTHQEDGYCYGQMSRNFYDEYGNTTYSSPVSYSDATQSPNKLTFKEGFELLFDDYNNDGNPDYTVKIDEDENGSTYYIECMSNDGTPRANPYGVEIYMAGAFEDSIRLQRYEDGYVVWRLDDETNEIKPNAAIEDYRMYSQRYYEPEPLNVYEADTERIVCYLWNNTKDEVTYSDKYSIERYVNGEWETVIDNLVCESGQTNAYSYSELSFDVSSMQETACYEYRIVLDVVANDKTQTVYGGFYMGNPNEKVENSNEAPTNDAQWYYFADNPSIEKDEKGNFVLTLENGIWTKETAKDVSLRGLYILKDNSWEEIYDYDTDIEGMDAYSVDISYGERVKINLKRYENDISYGLDLKFVMGYIWVRFPAIQCDSVVERLELTIGMSILDFLELDSEEFAQYLFWVTAFDYEDDSDSEALKSGDKCRLELSVGDYVEYVYFEVE